MDSYNHIFKKIYKKASDFFGINPKGIKLEVIKNRSILCSRLNAAENEIPWYAVGFYRKNKIIVLDKDIFPDVGHKKGEFERVILHEMCHIFIKKIVKKEIPVWVEEGLCQFISFGDIKLKPKKLVDLARLKTYKDWYNHDNPYIYCSSFFLYLGNVFGKEKILLFLGLLNRFNAEAAFKQAFGNELLGVESEFRGQLNEKAV